MRTSIQDTSMRCVVSESVQHNANHVFVQLLERRAELHLVKCFTVHFCLREKVMVPRMSAEVDRWLWIADSTDTTPQCMHLLPAEVGMAVLQMRTCVSKLTVCTARTPPEFGPSGLALLALATFLEVL